jgi:hypothetical protein
MSEVTGAAKAAVAGFVKHCSRQRTRVGHQRHTRFRKG